MITNFFIPALNNYDVQELWFQQDGATCHTARATIDLLKGTFKGRLISRFGPVNWPQDLTPCQPFKSLSLYIHLVSSHPILVDITYALANHLKKKYIRFCWIPGHAGITGNELADTAARSATGSSERFPIPHSDLKACFRQKLQSVWQSNWDQQTENKLHSVMLILAPTVPSSNNRREQVIWTRLRLGHTRLAHRHLLLENNGHGRGNLKTGYGHESSAGGLIVVPRYDRSPQWPSDSASIFHTSGTGFKPRAGRCRLNRHPFSVSINEYQACLGTKH
ncbi:RNase H domain-containing protein [Trichonephila clavipes]|nr:RNase H domain-containing protein [Trichonephila clavipes]